MPKRKSGDEEKPKKAAKPPAKQSAAQPAESPAEPHSDDSSKKSPKAKAESLKSEVDVRNNIDASKRVDDEDDLFSTKGFEPDDEGSESFEIGEDSPLLKMLQGGSLSIEEARESAVNSRNLLIESWNSRDELYRELFGEPAYVTPGPYAAPPVLKPEDVKLPGHEDVAETGDPGSPGLDEQHLNVLVYGPEPTRPYWTYITAGLSSPWLQEAPAEVTGFGCEIMLKTKEDMPWAVQLLRTMAFYILNHAGTLSPGVRINLNGPIIPNSDSKLSNIFIWYPDDAPDCWYYLPSGGFGLFIAIGITPDEREFAESIEEYGTWCIQQVLRQMGHEQVTDPHRGSVMDQEGIGLALLKTKSFADNFRENVAYDGHIEQ